MIMAKRDPFTLSEFGAWMLLVAIVGLVILALSHGCVEKIADAIPVAGVSLSEETAVTVPVTTGGSHSPVTVLTFTGAAPWGIVAMLAGLWGLSKRQGRRRMVGLDRVMRAIRIHKKSHPGGYKAIRDYVESQGLWTGKPDAIELLIRKRLEKWSE